MGARGLEAAVDSVRLILKQRMLYSGTTVCSVLDRQESTLAPILDTEIANIVFPSTTTSTAGVGGQDPESLSSIKTNAPTLRRTQDRAVTLEDYKSLVKGFPGVSKAHVLTSTTSGVLT